MQRIRPVTIALLLLATTLSACGDERNESAPPLKVMTFNVLCWFCNPLEYDPWEERLPYFGDIFARHDPDLIGLQELTPLLTPQRDDVMDILGQAPGYEAVYFHPAGVASYPDALILYRASRFTLLEQGNYWLSPTPDEPMSTGFASPQLPRLVVWARLFDNLAGRELYFANTHFDNNAPSQELSAPLVQERTAPFAGLPVIVVGDFNSRPGSAAFTTLVTDTSRGIVFQDSFELAPRRIVTNQSPEPEYDIDGRIDHIFVAGDGVSWSATDWLADLTVYGARSRYPSDHFPIVAEVSY